jgi:hypothetical protein
LFEELEDQGDVMQLAKSQASHEELEVHDEDWWIRVLWTFVAVVCGLMSIGLWKCCSWVQKLCCSRRRLRSAATQSQTTYSSVRGAKTGRFEVVPESSQGVWWND